MNLPHWGLQVLFLGIILLLAFIYIADNYIISIRIRAQLIGGAFRGISYAMQISYFVRIGIFLYNGLIGIIIDSNSNTSLMVFLCAILGNVFFLIAYFFENKTRSADVLRKRYQSNNRDVISKLDSVLLYLSQFLFQAAWLAPLIANNVSVEMKGTALAFGSFVNGFSGFINAFKLEPLMRKNSSNNVRLFVLYQDVRDIKRNTAYISIAIASLFLLVG